LPPYPAEGAYSTPTDILIGFKGAYFLGQREKEGKNERRGWEERGWHGKGGK